jgi:hypothetical protein
VTYISRVVDLPPTAAAHAFDQWLGDGSLSTTAVSIGPCSMMRHSAAPSGPLRAVDCRLPGRWRAMPAALELNPWSDEHAEIGLRWRGRRRPGEHYFELGHRLADELALRLELIAIWTAPGSLATRGSSRGAPVGDLLLLDA